MQSKLEPLCGKDWLEKHKNDYTQQDIDSLGIEISNGSSTFKIQNTKEGIKVLKEYARKGKK